MTCRQPTVPDDPIPDVPPPAAPPQIVGTLIEDTFTALTSGACSNPHCTGDRRIHAGQATVRDIHGAYLHAACAVSDPFALTPRLIPVQA